MKIGIYSICKNEIKFIDRLINSILSADEIVICDTGSTDGTYEKLLWYSDQYSNITIKKICVIPWRFDTAKNTALTSLSKDIDYCMSIDFDEILPDGFIDDLRNNILTEDVYHTKFNTVWNWENGPGDNITETWIERIHTRNNFIWKLPVHEKLTYTGNVKSEGWLSLCFHQKPDLSKSRPYLNDFELSLREDPGNWRTYCFYAIELDQIGDKAKAIDILNIGYDLDDADKAYIHYLKSNIYIDINEKIYELKQAVSIYPLREYYTYICRLYIELRERQNAGLYYDLAMNVSTKITGYKYDASCWDNNFIELGSEINNI